MTVYLASYVWPVLLSTGLALGAHSDGARYELKAIGSAVLRLDTVTGMCWRADKDLTTWHFIKEQDVQPIAAPSPNASPVEHVSTVKLLEQNVLLAKEALKTNPKLSGPFGEIPKDGWGTKIKAAQGLAGIVFIISAGPDKQFGTNDDIVRSTSAK